MDGTALDALRRPSSSPAQGGLEVGVWPGLPAAGGALLGPDRTQSGPPPSTLTVEELADLADSVQLRGRGGAGFPFAVKLRAVHEQARASGRRPVVVLNGEEGEPASAKDRVLMTLNPELALDGLRFVADALGADRSYAYISDARARERVTAAAAARSERGGPEIVSAPPGYVSGEETAVVRALSGGPAKPTHKPPRPFESGVDGRPTLVSNVETFAQLARLVRRRTAGSRPARPTVLLTLTTDRGMRSVVEVPDTVTLGDVLGWRGLSPGEILLGGFFGRFTSPETLRRSLRDLASREHLDLLGCGAVLVLHDTCAVTAVAQILRYLDRENAEQCGPCFKGIPSMADVVDDLAAGRAGPEDRDRLANWSTGLRGRGACGTLDAACGVVGSLLDQRGELVTRHLARSCHWCAQHPERPAATSFAIPWPTDIKEET